MTGPLSLLKLLGTCDHPSADAVIGLSAEWCWCTRCGSVLRVGTTKWQRPALVQRAVDVVTVLGDLRGR
jgi:hypothetical protein